MNPSSSEPDPEWSAHPSLADREPLIRYRVRRERYIKSLLRPKDRRLVYYAVVAALVVVIWAAPLRIRPGDVTPGPDCEAAPSPGVNWSYCRLEGALLPGVDLGGASLRNAYLRESSLPKARLLGADLSFAELLATDLNGANLTGALLLGANLRYANLSHAQLRGSDLGHANLLGASLEGADLTGAKLDHAIWIDGHVCERGSVGACKLSFDGQALDVKARSSERVRNERNRGLAHPPEDG